MQKYQIFCAGSYELNVGHTHPCTHRKHTGDNVWHYLDALAATLLIQLLNYTMRGV